MATDRRRPNPDLPEEADRESDDDAGVRGGPVVAGYDVSAVRRTALAWARERDYAGYDPYDGLNSPVLSAVSRHWLLRLLSIHGVQKFPMNLRPYLGIPEQRNPKGIGLFASAYLNEYERADEDERADGDAALREAERLLEWLADNRSPAFDRSSWGYNFDWQNSTKFYLPATHPCGVVTVFCARPFLRHYDLTGFDRSLEVARDAATFLLEDIGTEFVNGYEVLTYTPYDSYVAINANALAADLLWRVGRRLDEERFLDRARELFAFVVDAQTEVGGWHYSVPASDSHLGYDNFHTGFVLESLSRYAREKDADHPAREAYECGMEFHRENHFETDGAPKFEDDQSRPYDVHAAAQALITFTRRDDPDDAALASTVLAWTLDRLYDSEGYFYRRIGRMRTDETPYIRWSQGWMCLALSEYLGGR
ncbi:exopolysaccharide biosynthesis protein VpsJ [Halorubrum aquaticum]